MLDTHSDATPKRNERLAFELQDPDPDHEYLRARGFQSGTMKQFGVGYCAKGMMAGRIVVPIRNARGEPVAYAGRSVEETADEVYKYSPTFCRELRVYNLHQAIRSPLYADRGLVVVPDFFDVFRIFDAGYDNAVALMNLEMSSEQEALLKRVVGAGQKLTLFMPGASSTADLLYRLASVFFVHLATLGDHAQPANLDTEDLRRYLA